MNTAIEFKRIVLIGVITLGPPEMRAQDMTIDSKERTIVQNATYRIDSLNDYDDIPFGSKLYYAYRDIVIRSSSAYGPTIDKNDLELLVEAQKRSNFIGGAYQRLKSACEDPSHQNPSLAAKALADAEELEYSDRDVFLKLIFDQLSQDSQNQVVAIIEGLRGTKGITVVRIDYQSLWAEAPNFVLNAFANTCNALERAYASGTNPANTGTSIPISIGD